jgi:hypothetical protein
MRRHHTCAQEVLECKHVSYCAKVRQKADWKAHKKVCAKLTQSNADADANASTDDNDAPWVNANE